VRSTGRHVRITSTAKDPKLGIGGMLAKQGEMRSNTPEFLWEGDLVNRWQYGDLQPSRKLARMLGREGNT
jgi:hypothetical protein